MADLSIGCELLHRAALRRPAQFIVSMSPAELSLSMVAPPQWDTRPVGLDNQERNFLFSC
jgi:hypothetical protein